MGKTTVQDIQDTIGLTTC